LRRLTIVASGDGGSDPLNGKTKTTFVRPDGTELGMECTSYFPAYVEDLS
jgi:hypothetical protein